MSFEAGSFWKNKKVFLTGHTGFKGAWLSVFLDLLGAKVFGYSLPAEEISLFSQADLAGRFEEKQGDIRIYDDLSASLDSFAPEIVFHLAAQPLVRLSYKEPLQTYSTNVMGTVNLLEASRRCRSVKTVVVVTTDKCYKDMNWTWGYRENDSLGGADPYSSSKACVELISDAWRQAYLNGDNHARLATARAGNVIGGGDWAQDRLIPDAVRAFRSKVPLLIRSPNAVRPWQHVLDCLMGYLMLAEYLHTSVGKYWGEWNFGPSVEDARCVEEVVQKMIQNWGAHAQYRITENSDLHESHLLRLDSSRARQVLRWHPVLNVEEAIEWTCSWYFRWIQGENACELLEEQIRRYMGCMQ